VCVQASERCVRGVVRVVRRGSDPPRAVRKALVSGTVLGRPAKAGESPVREASALRGARS
jgi:hypothetical protein